jgi:hypothetical protein
MEKNKTSPFDVITPTPPGISWTAPEKSRPWLQPPRLTKVYDVASNYVSLLSSKEIGNELLDSLESGVPIAVIAESLMLGGVHQGAHTVDAGILAMPIIIEMLQTIADFNDIKVVTFPEDYDKESNVPDRIAKSVVNKLNEKKQEKVNEPVDKETTGFISKKIKEVSNAT